LLVLCQILCRTQIRLEFDKIKYKYVNMISHENYINENKIQFILIIFVNQAIQSLYITLK